MLPAENTSVPLILGVTFLRQLPTYHYYPVTLDQGWAKYSLQVGSGPTRDFIWPMVGPLTLRGPGMGAQPGLWHMQLVLVHLVIYQSWGGVAARPLPGSPVAVAPSSCRCHRTQPCCPGTPLHLPCTCHWGCWTEQLGRVSMDTGSGPMHAGCAQPGV